MSDKKTYRLYAIPADSDYIEKTAAERFVRITSDYALIYTSGEAPSGAVMLNETHERLMTENDKKWLFDCNMAIIAEEMKEREKELCGDLTEQLNLLEELLEAESKKSNGKKDGLKNGSERTA